MHRGNIDPQNGTIQLQTRYLTHFIVYYCLGYCSSLKTTVTVYCRTAIKALFLYCNWYFKCEIGCL